MIVTYENNGLYSAASAAGCMFYSVSRIEAERQLIEAGIDAECLDSPVDGVTWRSTLTSAMVNEIAALDAAIGIMASVEDVSDLRERLDILHDRQTDLSVQVRAADIRTEIARAEAEMDRQLPIMRKIMGAKAEDWEVRMMVNHGPLGKRLQALLSEMRESI